MTTLSRVVDPLEKHSRVFWFLLFSLLHECHNERCRLWVFNMKDDSEIGHKEARERDNSVTIPIIAEYFEGNVAIWLNGYVSMDTSR